jgi:hypothetical protein
VQEVPGAIGSAFSTPAYFNNQIYYQGSGDVMKAFIITTPSLPHTRSQATTSFSAYGGTPSISANGTNNGIVWTIQSDAFASGGPAFCTLTTPPTWRRNFTTAARIWPATIPAEPFK